ncbi:MAG: ribonuclease, partial [Thermoleophilaceae bacterium]|nr:ribonuclease [Thermoleophilaceae bacterium]
AEAFDEAVEIIGGWSRDERREGVKILLQALAERSIGRRDQATAWLWRLAEYTRDVHEEYAVQRWPETKRLLGLLVNSSGGAHARNARRLVQASRKQDRRLSAALLAAALAHTPEAEEVLRGARTRMARKPSALARDLLRNFPKGRRRRGGRRRKRGGEGDGEQTQQQQGQGKRRRSAGGGKGRRDPGAPEDNGAAAGDEASDGNDEDGPDRDERPDPRAESKGSDNGGRPDSAADDSPADEPAAA